MKDALRRHFISQLQSIPETRRVEASQKLCAFLEEYSASFERVASFLSLRCEIDLSSFNLKLAKSERLLLPRRSSSSLQYFSVNPEQIPQKTSNNLAEPDPNLCISTKLTDKDLLLVPALAFDQNHFRLGLGKGYFDRFLADHPFVLTAGIGFCEQKSSEPLPRDPWDIPVRLLFLF